MKKLGFVFCTACLLAACNNNGATTENKLDSFGNKIENATEKVVDSAKAKGERVVDRIDDKIDGRDSSERASQHQDTSKH